MLENIYDVLRSPQKAFIRIAEQENLKKAFLLQLGIMAINLLVDKNGTGLSLGQEAVYFIMAIPVMVFFWCLSAGLIHGVAHLMGGRGTWKKQLIVTSYSLVPEIVFVPLQIAVLWLGLAEEIIAILAIISCVWCLTLSVYAVKIVQKLGTVRSILTVFMPSVVVILLGVVVFFMTIATMY